MPHSIRMRFRKPDRWTGNDSRIVESQATRRLWLPRGRKFRANHGRFGECRHRSGAGPLYRSPTIRSKLDPGTSNDSALLVNLSSPSERSSYNERPEGRTSRYAQASQSGTRQLSGWSLRSPGVLWHRPSLRRRRRLKSSCSAPGRRFRIRTVLDPARR